MDEKAVLFHNLRSALTAIKNALSFILEGYTQKDLNRKTKYYLKEALKKSEELIQMTLAMEKKQ